MWYLHVVIVRMGHRQRVVPFFSASYIIAAAEGKADLLTRMCMCGEKGRKKREGEGRGGRGREKEFNLYRK